PLEGRIRVIGGEVGVAECRPIGAALRRGRPSQREGGEHAQGGQRPATHPGFARGRRPSGSAVGIQRSNPNSDGRNDGSGESGRGGAGGGGGGLGGATGPGGVVGVGGTSTGVGGPVVGGD